MSLQFSNIETLFYVVVDIAILHKAIIVDQLQLTICSYYFVRPSIQPVPGAPARAQSIHLLSMYSFSASITMYNSTGRFDMVLTILISTTPSRLHDRVLFYIALRQNYIARVLGLLVLVSRDSLLLVARQQGPIRFDQNKNNDKQSYTALLQNEYILGV